MVQLLPVIKEEMMIKIEKLDILVNVLKVMIKMLEFVKEEFKE